MKNLNSNEVKEFSVESTINYLNECFRHGPTFVTNQLSTILFSVGDLVVFGIYISPNQSITENSTLKVHIFEKILCHKNAYTMRQITPKFDERFMHRPWAHLFSPDPRNAAVVLPHDLVDMMKFSARLSLIKIFA